MKSIKLKIIALSIGSLIAVVSVLSMFSIANNYNNTMKTVKILLAETALEASLKVEAELNGYIQVMLQVANNPEIGSDKTEEQVIAVMQGVIENSEFSDIRRTNIEGVIYGTKTNIADREYFIACKDSGAPIISDPLVARDGGKSSFVIAVPVLKSGIFDGVVFGAVNLSRLSEISKAIKVGETGRAYILDKNGTTIGAYDDAIVESKENVQELAKTDKGLTQLAALELDMTKGNFGVGEYSYGGKDKLLAYASINGTNGWSLAIGVVRLEYTQTTIDSIILTLVISMIGVLLAGILSFLIASKISKPIVASTKRLQLLAQGDLTTPVPTTKAKDETKLLIDATNQTINGLNEIISDITQKLDAMANENLDLVVTKEYPGDFAPVESSLKQIITSFNNVISHIKQAASQVASGSDQVASGAQSLSQGSTEQASSLQELSATINEISDQVKQTAISSGEANKLASVVGDEVENSNQQMDSMMDAISKISISSVEIGAIIKTIDDIAFQTNMLALNAAVEAARAGAAGKGFAVVAEEVRSLAAKSAQAAKNTTDLIEGSLEAVENGSKIAGITAQSLKKVIEGTEKIAELISDISKAANEEATAIGQVTQGVEQVSGVVQTTSATAEESAAASEELSSQATLLNELVSKFILRGDIDEQEENKLPLAVEQPFKQNESADSKY